MEDAATPLPMELVLCVFDIAAESSRDIIPSLCLVASWAYSLYLPQLLCIVNLRSDRQSREFMARVPADRISDRLSHVRTIWIDHGVQHAQHNPALQAYDMPQLRHLSVPYSLFTSMVLSCCVRPAIGLHAVLSGGVPELALCMRALWDGHPLPHTDDFINENGINLPVLNAITHLQLTCPAIGRRSPVFLCANLTHLAMPFVGAMGFSSPMRSLEMMVFVVPSYRSLPTHWDCRMRVVQARRSGRAIFSVTEIDEQFKDRWLETVTGEYPNIWERARSQTELLEQLYGECGGNWDAIQILWQERSSRDNRDLPAVSGRSGRRGA